MAKKSEIQIIISAVDKASKELGGVGSALNKLGKVGLIAGAAVAGVAAGIGAAAFKLAKDAAPIQGITAAFDGLTASMEGGSKGVLKSLKDSSFGMIKQSVLMKSFNEATTSVSKDFAEKLPDAMRYFAKIAAATGEDTSYMMDSYVKGISKLSPMILDNLKIQVDQASANEAYALSIGKTVGELSKEEQQIALNNQALEMLRIKTADMPEVAGSATQSFAAFKTKIANLREEIGLKLLPVFQTIADKLLELWDKPEVQAGIDTLISWIGNVIGDEDSGLIGVINTLSEGGISSLIAEAFGFEPSDKFTDMLDKLLQLDPGETEKNLSEIKGVWEKYFGAEGELTKIGEGFYTTLDQIGSVYQAAQLGEWELAGVLIGAIFGSWSQTITTKWQEWVGGLEKSVSDVDWSKLGSNIIKDFGNGITSAFNWFVTNVINPFQRLLTGLTSGGIVPSPAPLVGRASGGSVFAGKSYLVGERGPEILTMGGAGYVTPNHRLGGAGGQSLALTVNINSAVNLADRSYAERELMPYIEAGVRQLMARSA